MSLLRVLRASVLRACSLGLLLAASALGCRTPATDPLHVASEASVPAIAAPPTCEEVARLIGATATEKASWSVPDAAMLEHAVRCNPGTTRLEISGDTRDLTALGGLASLERLRISMSAPQLEIPETRLKAIEIQCREHCGSVDWKRLGARLPRDAELWVLGSSSTILRTEGKHVGLHYVTSPTGKEACGAAPSWIQDLFDVAIARNPSIDSVKTDEPVALDALTGLTSLAGLSVPATQLGCLPDVPNLRNLTLVDRAESIDLALLSRFPELEVFAAAGTEARLTAPLELRGLNALTVKVADAGQVLKNLRSAPLVRLELHGDLPDATALEPFAATLQTLTVDGRVGPTRPLTELRELVDLRAGDVEDLDVLQDAPKLQRLVTGKVAKRPPQSARAPAILSIVAKGVRDLSFVRSLTTLFYFEAALEGRPDLTALVSLPKLRELVLLAPSEVPDRSRVDATPLARSSVANIRLGGCVANVRAVVGRSRSMLHFPADSLTEDEIQKLSAEYQIGSSLGGAPCRTPKAGIVAQ